MTVKSGPRRFAIAALILGLGVALLHAGAPAELAVSRLCRLMLDPHDKFTRVVPNSVQRSAPLTADLKISTITVNYGAGYPEAAQIAFASAVDIWQTQVNSPISIVVDANWVDFGSTGLLAESGVNCQFHDFPGAISSATWFVSAIAERLSGTFMSGDCGSPHQISVSVNSTASWYFGTDGVPTTGKVDFVSVALHELTHGLGFIGTANVASGLGTIGLQGMPFIYDANVVDSAGTSILNAGVYPNGSTTMASLLQGTGVSGAGLFWGGAHGAAANGGVRPVLFAPSSFQSGSSYLHLDETTYPAGTINSLMTPTLGFAEVIHTPGPITLGTLTDMGWGNQTGSGCSFGLDQYTANVPPSGGTVSVELVTAVGCAWTASSNSPSFVTITSPTPASGNTSAQIQMSVAPNSNPSARAGTVTIGTETLTIAQQGTSPCPYSLSPTSATVSAAGQTGSVTLTSAPGCYWTAATSDGTVAAITTDPQIGQGTASIGYVVSGNTGPAARSATLTIGGQAFAITQSACGYAVDNTSLTVSGATSTATVNVTTPATCQWTASSSASFITLVNGATGTGPGPVQFSVAANPTQSPRSGTVTVAGQTVTINQGPGLTTMTIDRTSLNFGAIVSPAGMSQHTDAQLIRLTQSGLPGTVTWTASSDQPWLTVARAGTSGGASASGSGSAVLSVGVQFDPSVSSAPGKATGSITIVLTGANGTVGPVAVNLALIPPGQSTAPFGSFDSPADGATGVAGSVAVTGWSLDDIQVMKVTLCRDGVPGEAVGPDARCNGAAQVYIGDAVFVDGARPDVAAAFPAAPMFTRGGWGYLLLTNVLPNTGNGTFRFVAYAYDPDGHVMSLGAKTITCDNADSLAPFGGIDTPGQGAVVSGVVSNFGWVLSPGARRSDPPGGGTVTVYVDGAPVGSPGGWTSRSDLSALFPVSQYSGVETALGVFGLDTTTLANGVHTIAWVVTDTLGVTSGLGSRFFTVSNGSSVLAGARAASVAASGIQADDRAIDAGGVSTPAVADAGSILLGRVGFDVNAPQQYFFPGADGVVTIRAQELDRIELQLEPGATGVQITPQGERPLPAGARIDPATGAFTWAPGAGFIGSYDFVIGAHRVRIVLRPKAPGLR